MWVGLLHVVSDGETGQVDLYLKHALAAPVAADWAANNLTGESEPSHRTLLIHVSQGPGFQRPVPPQCTPARKGLIRRQ